MSGYLRYGWVSYYFNLLLLTPMSHQQRMKFIQRKARAAEASSDPDVRLRILLHCTDWPIDLLQASSATHEAHQNHREMEELQKEMVERYQMERSAQGRF